MTFKDFKLVYRKLFLLVFVGILPVVTINAKDKVLEDKRIKVVMRKIGHEVLLCLGDQESRVMPIEKKDNQYRIPFEFEFGFDPFIFH